MDWGELPAAWLKPRTATRLTCPWSRGRGRGQSPAGGAGPDLGIVEDVQDGVRLGFGVGPAVVPPDDGGRPLAREVAVRGRRVRAQVVAEQQMLAFPGAAGPAQVQGHPPGPL